VKKIVIFIYSLSAGGAERVATDLAGYFADHNYMVTILTMVGTEKDFYKLHPEVIRDSLDIAKVSNNKFEAFWINLKRIYKLRKYLKSNKPKVVISLMTRANILAVFAAIGLPLVLLVSEHIYPQKTSKKKLWNLIRILIYRLADRVVVLTRKNADWMKKNTLARKVDVIPNPICWPMSKQDPIVKPESYFTEDRKILLAVGRFVRQKGFDLLIESFADIADSYRDWDLVILGEGPDKPKIEELINSYPGLSKRVYLPGRVGNIGDWYLRVDLYVLSSRFEGFSNTVLEALASGCPVVSFDCDAGPSDIISDGVDGLLVPPEDTNALAKALVKLMENEELRKEFGNKAKAVRNTYSIDKIGLIWEEKIAESALKRKHTI
jgi:glycosyltransferase involved in cell wall biosynthesis